MAVKPIPNGYHSVTPYLIVHDGAGAIEFYKKAFGAVELMRLPHGDKIGHAEVKIGDSPVMLADEYPDMGVRGPKSLGGTTFGINLYVPNSDAMFAQAVAAGATVDRPLQNQFYGDRSGTVIDPYGHKWTISTHVEDVTPEQIAERMAGWVKQQQSQG